MSQTILIVDDEQDVVDLVRFNLIKAGFETLVARDGIEALTLARNHVPDAIVLDVMLPGKTGLEVCRELKTDADLGGIPVMMLSARVETPDRINGLELGADDYVTKPFSPRELVLRVQKLIRRIETTQAATRTIGELVLDRVAFDFSLRGRRLQFTSLEFKLLAALVERQGKTIGRDKLLSDVWGYKNFVDSRTVDTHIRRVRDKLGHYAKYLETVRGIGYRFIFQPDDTSPGNGASSAAAPAAEP